MEYTALSPHLLQELIHVLEKSNGVRIIFADLSGVSRDVPNLHLPEKNLRPSCRFCACVKGHGLHECNRNRLVLNRARSGRYGGFYGSCHVGLLDLVEPLLVGGKVLGVFHCEPLTVRDYESENLARIVRYCLSQAVDPSAYLEAWKTVPRIDAAEVPRYQKALRIVAKLALHFCEQAFVVPEQYEPVKSMTESSAAKNPYLVQATIRYVREHIAEHFIVKDIAAHLKCHPNSLSRLFKRRMKVELSDYIRRLRFEQACRLLEVPNLTIGQASERAGFSDHVHFSKLFRQMSGMTPRQYREMRCGRAGVGARGSACERRSTLAQQCILSTNQSRTRTAIG